MSVSFAMNYLHILCPFFSIMLWEIEWKINPLSVFFFTAAPEAYGSSQSRGQMGATAATLYHNHSIMVWDPSHICNLYHSSWQSCIPDPMSEVRD